MLKLETARMNIAVNRTTRSTVRSVDPVETRVFWRQQVSDTSACRNRWQLFSAKDSGRVTVFAPKPGNTRPGQPDILLATNAETLRYPA